MLILTLIKRILINLQQSLCNRNCKNPWLRDHGFFYQLYEIPNSSFQRFNLWLLSLHFMYYVRIVTYFVGKISYN